MNFSERVRGLVTASGEAMKLTDEQKDALLKVQSAGNTEVYENLPTSVNSIDITKAIEAANTGSGVTNTEIFSDKIDLTTGNGHVTIPCASSKASNIATGDLKDASVWKAMSWLNVHQVLSTVANAAIRSDSLLPFTPKSTAETKDIVKKCSIRDFSMSGTIFPEDIHDTEEWNKFADFQHKYKAALLATFLCNAAKMQLSDDMRLTIYRCANRSMAEDIFDSVWKEYNPFYDESDPVQVSDHNDALRAYNGALENIGSKYMSNISVKFGLQFRKMSISPNPKWTSTKKVGHVKSFGPGKSCYVTTNIDSGIMTVPMTSKMLSDNLNNIVLIAQTGAALIEREVRKQNGLTGEIKIPDYSSIKYDEKLLGKRYYELLGITETVEAAIYENLTKQYKEKAETVVEAIQARNDNVNASTLQELLGYNK